MILFWTTFPAMSIPAAKTGSITALFLKPPSFPVRFNLKQVKSFTENIPLRQRTIRQSKQMARLTTGFGIVTGYRHLNNRINDQRGVKSDWKSEFIEHSPLLSDHGLTLYSKAQLFTIEIRNNPCHPCSKKPRTTNHEWQTERQTLINQINHANFHYRKYKIVQWKFLSVSAPPR